MKNIILLLFSLALTSQVIAQKANPRLANQYFKNGEYEKALTLYEKLHKSNTKSDQYFSRYLDCLSYLEEYEKAENLIKQRIKKRPNDAQIYVTYGNFYSNQYLPEKADEQYKLAIDKLVADKFKIINLANLFNRSNKYDLAIATYEKGSALLKDNQVFSYNLADLYRKKGEDKKMITNYLNSLANQPSRLSSIRTIFQRTLNDEGFDELQTQLYEKAQDNPDEIMYPEMLMWVFEQRKDYKNALRQARAIDKRLNEKGVRVFQLAQRATRVKKYDAAIKAFNYIIEEKGKEGTYYIEAKREVLKCQRLKLTQGFTYTSADLKSLEGEYLTFLKEFGYKKTTASIVKELAELYAFHMDSLDRAITLLDEMIKYPSVNAQLQAKAKLMLGDLYLMQGERWESTLLYSQVDKAFREDLLGQEARFKNAKLSYYMADFEWAQEQFDILKASTSRLISNDALDLSVFIMDNLALDTSSIPMETFAKADLLLFQNKLDEAVSALDAITSMFPEHALIDDILYTKAQVHYKKREYDKAAILYEQIVAEHTDGIRADNSMYALAQMYENENQLNNKEKAKELYKRILTEYSGSTFSVDARKRFRILRGDVQ